jgi:hypothetical protein
MKAEMVEKAVRLAKKTGLVFVATSDAAGSPHMTTAGGLLRAGSGKVRVSAWFCPQTVVNLHCSHRVSVVVWDRQRDEGIQLTGEVEEAKDRPAPAAYDPVVASRCPVPHVEKQLLVRVSKAVQFSRGPHSDVEE